MTIKTAPQHAGTLMYVCIKYDSCTIQPMTLTSTTACTSKRVRLAVVHACTCRHRPPTGHIVYKNTKR